MPAIDIPAQPDLDRMRRDRGARLRSGMEAQGVDALLLLGNSNVSYATGLSWPLGDSGRANVERPVAVVLATDDAPHLFAPYPDEAALELDLPEDHVHGSVYLDFDEAVESFARTLGQLLPSRAVVAVDELTGAMHRCHEQLPGQWPPRGSDEVVGGARLSKTPDELACLRHALSITEQAMAEVQAKVAPGVRQTDLTAHFLHVIFDHGAEANILDPIWQIMPPRRADLPWTTHGDLPCPLLSTERELAEGDVLWVDTGIMFAGYHSDFGRTWVVGREPTTRQQAQFWKWREIMDAVLAVTRAGATAADLTRAASAVVRGGRPWMPHFYLAHGLGVDSAEMPFVGTDLGDEFDASLVLVPGMVFMLEPIVWDEGASGYRSEDAIVITEEGWISLTDYPYDPYGG
jgi:Xaa-Pro aminopeptidase